MENDKREAKQRNTLAFLGRVILGFSILTILDVVALFFEGALDTHDFVTLVCLFLIILSLVLGAILTKFYSFEQGPIVLSEGFFIVGMAWITVSLIASLPFIALSPEHGRLEPYKAIFEAVSGMTATGLTVYDNVEMLPRAILFWRSLTEWIGGLGVATVFLGFLIHYMPVARSLYRGEGRESDQIVIGNVLEMSKRVTVVYVMLTLLVFSLFRVLGMTTFDAINHSMTAIATGGFSTKNDSLAGYNLAIHYAAILGMFLGAISFDSHLNLFRNPVKNLKKFFNKETITLILIPLVFSGLYLLMTYYSRVFSIRATHNYLFTAISAITGTGFSVSDVSQYSELSKVTLIVLMVIGGCYGSTSSAIKIFRLIILWDILVWIVRKASYSPNVIVPLRVLGRQYKIDELMNSLAYVLLYILSLLTASMILMTILGNSWSFVDVFFEVASAQGNVGLSVGISGPSIGVGSALVLIIVMLLGRLEIIPWVVFSYELIRVCTRRPLKA